MSKVVIELQNIKRNFQVGDETVHALRGVSFSITEGEFVTRVSSLTFLFLDQNRYDTSFKALIIMSL